MADFEKALKYTLKNEGGFSDIPEDRGGPTNLGLTFADLRWMGIPATVAAIKALTPETAAPIYEKKYWLPLMCEQIKSDSIGTALFDIGVVRGLRVPVRYAQIICNTWGDRLAEDGEMGAATLGALNGVDPAEFIRAFVSRTEEGFRAIAEVNASQRIFLKGWVSRARRLLTLVSP